MQKTREEGEGGGQVPGSLHLVPVGCWQQVTAIEGLITLLFVVFQDSEDTGRGDSKFPVAPCLAIPGGWIPAASYND